MTTVVLVARGGRNGNGGGKRLLLWIWFLAIVCWLATQIRMMMMNSHGSDQQEQQSDVINNHNAAAIITTNNNSTTATASSSAGCLLVMDDNHRLVEWIAYHYYTMNLRYLIVAVDPRSQTSPLSILQRWQPLGLKYEIWNDNDYMGNRVRDKRLRLNDLKRKQLTMVHRVRQKAFYQFCLEKLDSLQTKGGSGWTLMIDVDEFYVLKSKQDSSMPEERHKEIMSTPGGLLSYIQQQADQIQQTQEAQAQAQEAQQQFASPCVVIPRLLFGVKEEEKEIPPNETPAFIVNLQKQKHDIYLDTNRWFYHAYYSDFERNGLAKPLLDLSRIQLPKPHFPNPVNPHRPFQHECRDPKKIYDIQQTAKVEVHHYLSTWETYSFRNDSRKGGERSKEAWEYRALGEKANQVGPNYDILPWLDGFIQYFGIQQATQLLEGAGLKPTTQQQQQQRNDNDKSDGWNFESQLKQDYLNPLKPQQYDSNYGKFLREQQQQKEQKE